MIRNLILILLLTSLTACIPKDIEDYADDTKEAKATEFIQKLIDGEFEDIESAIEPSLKLQLNNELLQQMSNILGSDEILERQLIGYQTHSLNQQPTRFNLSYQYGYADKWIVVNVAFRTLENGQDEIFGLNVYNPMNQPLQELHKFTLVGKGSLHYVFLAMGIFVPVFILYTLISAIRTKFKKRKWMWIIFIIIGIAQFSINWTTGQVGLKILNVQLFGSGIFTSSIYAPWILSFSIPIGAILYWVRRDKIRFQNPQSLGEEESVGKEAIS